MGKTRDLFKHTGDIKGLFPPRMGTIKDRNGKDLTKPKRLRRGGKNTQKNYTKKKKKNVMTRITTILDTLTNITKWKQTDKENKLVVTSEKVETGQDN